MHSAYSLAVRPIYPPIDWVSLKAYILGVLSVVLTFLMHFVCRVIFRRCKEVKEDSTR